MSDESMKWDEQWSVLLTRCYGAEVQANPEFKSSLLDALKRKTAESLADRPELDEASDENWQRLLTVSYVPCHPDPEYKSGLLGQLKAKQQKEFQTSEAIVSASAATAKSAGVTEDEMMSTILQKSYQPIQPRREFQTRLLENLKERQRNTSIIRRTSRRRTFFLSTASSLAAAAMVVFILSLVPHGPGLESMPASVTTAQGEGQILLPLPPTAYPETPRQFSNTGFTTSFASLTQEDTDRGQAAAIVPASYTSDYRVADAFAGDPLPGKATALRDVEMNSGDGWVAMKDNVSVPIAEGMSFRASNIMGHLQVDNGSLISLSPDSILTATTDGLTVEQGFLLVETPDVASKRFRLHFPARDIAVEPGTDLAVLVEPASKYADGGAPAPMVMVVDRPGENGGLALAKGKAGVGPLFTRQLYRLDNYVTPDLPGRTMCDAECADLYNIAEMRTSPRNTYLLAGSNAGIRQAGGTTTMVVTPAGYSRKGDKWVADSYENQSTIKLKYLSDAYFGFANERRDLASALALGSRVVIDGGDNEFYEIYK